MPRPAPGRRTDSLFDNRFRYDYIYPRGRSGETLRAYDTLDADRPVVIKRPALQDAPPLRAGQEVSIINEQRALERLAGHPVLSELRHAGTFRVGNQAHHYIALDLAGGKTVEDFVLELSAKGERLPDLETLVILDSLLDLLQAAHDKKIVYNDVDAKHLFWDRENYRLKVIDWGNAVFLDDPSPSVNRTADSYQVGELIHFILTGGKRLDLNRGPDSYAALSDEIPPRMKTIISKAAAADSNQRYQDVGALRRDLADVRRPIEKTRDQSLERVRARLATATSQDQFGELAVMLRDSQRQDPGHPATKALLAEVEARLRQLALQGDLDAARIYIESGNYERALTLLNDLVPRVADMTEQPLLAYLIAAAELLHKGGLGRPPAGLAPALKALFQGDAAGAGRALVLTPELRLDAKDQQYMLAEQLTALMPGVALLRPHLAHVDSSLAAISRSGERAVLMRLTAALEGGPDTARHGLRGLRAAYSTLADTIGAVADWLDTEGREACARAERAATDIADLLEIVGQNVLSDPPRAGNALRQAAAIDPSNPSFESASQALTEFHQVLDRIADARPGGEILSFLDEATAQLAAYQDEIPDAQLRSLQDRALSAQHEVEAALEAFSMGGRRPAVEAYERAAEATKPLNEHVSRWFAEHARLIEQTRYVEALHPNAAFARAITDGWDAWDRGRAGEAQNQAQRAIDVGTTPTEKAAGERLVQVAALTNTWLAGNGFNDPALTEDTERALAALFTPAEVQIQRKFTEQMPNMTVYLKAMTRGLVDPLKDSSSAAGRILLMSCVLKGVQALQRGDEEETTFWKDAATRALIVPRTHPVFAALENAITRRTLITGAVQALIAVRGIEDLPNARAAVRQPLVADVLDPADQALRALDEALKRWADGDFRTTHAQLQSALERIAQAEQSIAQPLTPFVAWIKSLDTVAESLVQSKRTIEQAALMPTAAVNPAVADAHWEIYSATRGTLGEDYTAVVKQWRDTYATIKDLYTDDRFDKAEKTRLIEGHFASLFIDRHPAYPIYRYWSGLIQQAADPQPVTLGASFPVPLKDRPQGGDTDGDLASADTQSGDTTPSFIEDGPAPRPARVIDLARPEARGSAISAAVARAALPAPETAPASRPLQADSTLVSAVSTESGTASTALDETPEESATGDAAPRVPWVAGFVVVLVVLVAAIGAVVIIGGRPPTQGGIALTVPVTARPGDAPDGVVTGSALNPTAPSAALVATGYSLRTAAAGLNTPLGAAPVASASGSATEPESNLATSLARTAVAALSNTKVTGAPASLTALPSASFTPSTTPTALPSTTPTPLPPTLTSTPTAIPPTVLVPTETRPFATLPPFETAIPATDGPSQTPTIQIAPSVTAPVAPTIPPLAPTKAPALVPLAGGTGIATATLPIDVAPGEYDLLKGLNSASPDSFTWPTELFQADPAEGGWKLGVASSRSGNVRQLVRILPNTLATLYGPSASRQVQQVTATMELTSFNQALVSSRLVYFGMGFEAPAGSQSAFAQVSVAQVSPLSAYLGTNINGRLNYPGSQPGNPIKVTLTARRNSDRTVTLLVNGQEVGKSAAVYGPATAVNIVLYTSAPTVFVNISMLKVTFG